MLKPKFKIGDKVFDKFIAKGKDAFIYTNTIIGIHYVLPFELEGADGTVKNAGGKFEYTVIDYDNNKFTQVENSLGKRRKQ